MIMDIPDKSDIPAPDEVNRYAILAKLPPEHMLTVKGVASCLACSVRTVWRYVHSFQLPPPVRMGNKSIWTVGHLYQWDEKRRRDAEAAANREALRLRDYEFRS